jgi:nucleoside-diphosphate-sugar epimerase
VDVRDVAHAHVLALENENAEGRHILAERTAGVMDLIEMIRTQFPGKYKLPRSKAPKWLLMLIGGMFGVTPRFVKRNVGYPIRLNTTRSREKLGLSYRPMDEMVRDMVENIG